MSERSDKKLVRLFCSISDTKTMSDVLSNMFTRQEIEEFIKRLMVFEQLIEGENSQRDIAKNIGVSLGTVTRGSRELKYGKPGISKIINGRRVNI